MRTWQWAFVPTVAVGFFALVVYLIAIEPPREKKYYRISPILGFPEAILCKRMTKTSCGVDLRECEPFPNLYCLHDVIEIGTEKKKTR